MAFSLFSCAEMQQVMDQLPQGTGVLSQAEIGNGLKEALNNGITKQVTKLTVTDGFLKNEAVKILLPSELQVVDKKLRQIGLSSLADEGLKVLNRAAEDAVKEATPIFVDAVKQMTFNDAKNILMGNNTAATTYLQNTTSNALYSKFNPVIKNSFAKVGADKVWTNIITKYNSIPLVKKVNPDIIFMGEAYDPTKYELYVKTGKFDYLYDKVGLYDALKRLIKNDSNANVKEIDHVISKESVNIPQHMLRFLENHDEERLASQAFAKNPFVALPAMVVTATLGSGPVMIYFGQEVGEPGRGIEGFGGDDDRTSIFDYWGVPNHQKWLNGGAFDGGKLNQEEKKLRLYYQKLLNLCASNKAIQFGKTISLNAIKENQKLFGKKVYGFVRQTANERVLVIANFDQTTTFNQKIKLPTQIRDEFDGREKSVILKNALTGAVTQVKDFKEGLNISLKPSEAIIYSF